MKTFADLIEYINNNETPIWIAGLNLLRWANINACKIDQDDFMDCFEGDFADLDNRLGNSNPEDWFENAPNWDELEIMEF